MRYRLALITNMFGITECTSSQIRRLTPDCTVPHRPVGQPGARRARWFVPVALAAATLVGCTTSVPHYDPPGTVTVTAPSATTIEAPATQTSPGRPAPAKVCALADVRPQITLTTQDAGQRHTTVTWTNQSDSTCTMYGYSGADLDGPPPSPYSLPRQTSAEPLPVTLPPGGQAHTVITWLPGDWAPTTLVLTPPDEVHSAVLDWPGGGVLRQDGATRPGTYVGPVEPGAGA